MCRKRAEKRPVSDRDKEHTSASIENIVTNPVLFIDACTRGASDIGGGGGQSDNVAHEKRMPGLARKTPVQWIIGRLCRRGNEDDIAMLFDTGIAGSDAGVLVGEETSCARKDFIEIVSRRNGHPRRFAVVLGSGVLLSCLGANGSSEPHSHALRRIGMGMQDIDRESARHCLYAIVIS